jgi:tRNA pseudouridine65 synthase
MVVHRGWAQDETTVYDVVRDEIIRAPIHTVHRLDRGTSGVLLFALQPEVAQWIQQQMVEGRVYKRYLALVRGPLRDRWFIHHPIKQPPMEHRVEATTEFIPLAHSGRWTLIEARPITGRTHQIRMHLRHIGHPIVGDVNHGKGEVNRFFRDEYGFSRLALHAAEFVLPHPDGTRSVAIKAPLPQDFQNVLTQLGIALSQ